MIASRQETEEREKRVKELEELEARNLEKYKEATHLCFYKFWKYNQEANFNYFSERLRRTLMSQCVIRLEEEERANVPASPEISLATGIDGADNEVGAAVDQDAPQDPPAS